LNNVQIKRLTGNLPSGNRQVGNLAYRLTGKRLSGMTPTHHC